MGVWLSKIKLSNVHLRIDHHVRASLTYCSQENTPLFFGLYGRDSIFQHQAVIVSYVVRVGPDPSVGIYTTAETLKAPNPLCLRCFQSHHLELPCPTPLIQVDQENDDDIDISPVPTSGITQLDIPSTSSSSSSDPGLVDPPPGIEIRSLLVELFVDATDQKILQVRRLLSAREGYVIKDFCFVSGVSLKTMIDDAQTIFSNTGGYHFVFNNCRHFSQDFFRHMKEKYPSHSLALDATILRKYWQRFPPAYQERTQVGSYLSYTQLVVLYPPDHPVMRDTPDGSFDFRAQAGKFFLGIHSAQVARENLQIGDVVSVEMDDLKPFHHFAVMLGPRAGFIQLLKSNRAIALLTQISPIKYDRLIHALEASSAVYLHFDHNGKRVAIRDFDKHFYISHTGSIYKVDSLPDVSGRQHSIPSLGSEDDIRALLLRILPLIGLPVYDSRRTCTCTAAAAHGIDLQLDPQIPLGAIGAAVFDKYLVDQEELDAIPEDCIFGEMMLKEEARYANDDSTV